MIQSPVLQVLDLHVSFPSPDGLVRAVDGVTYDLYEGETLGIVGESGSGKSVSAMAIMGLLPKYAVVEGSIKFRGEELLGKSEKSMRSIRGAEISVIFQDALAALNPVITVGAQILEALKVHENGASESERKGRVIELLEVVGIPDPGERAGQYPHEYSGGMRQRAMIAMALANDPAVLIADEPTTALDVTIQAQVLDVFQRIQDRTSTSVMLITHDLGVVAGTTDRVMVMYAGRQAEIGTVDEIFYEPKHPYTAGLLESLPRLDRRTDSSSRLYRIHGQPPSLVFVPTGCAFHPRCPVSDQERCITDKPIFRDLGSSHMASCHYPDEAVKLLGTKS